MNGRWCTSSVSTVPLFTTPDGGALIWNEPYGPPSNEPTPFVLPGGLEIDFATGGLDHCLILTTDGRLFTWGQNKFGQLGRDWDPDKRVPGEVVLPTNSKVVEIACAVYYSAALTEDGRVWTWGNNTSGQLGREAKPCEALPGMVYFFFFAE
jgi:alpha-tubulin suppressor-like RCC1 family protein